MSNHRKFKNKLPGSILFQVVVLALLSSCFQTYHFTNGEKYRNFFPVKDVYMVSESELEEHKFDLDNYLNPDTVGIIQYVFPENIMEIVDSIDRDFLVIFYYPNCHAVKNEFEIAQFAKENSIPFIMISDIYSPGRMKELYREYGLENKNQYIIPSMNRKGRFVLKKRLEFIKRICPSCYDKQKDELIFATLLKVAINGNLTTEPMGGYGKEEFYTDWIKQEFDLKTP